MRAQELIDSLEARANPANVEGMARFGINPAGTLGVTMPVVRSLARDTRRALHGDANARHELAGELWQSGIHEARILAALVDVPARVTEDQMEHWVGDLDSWDVCDQLCGNLFDKAPLAWEKAAEWSGRESEFVKRAGFVLMAQLAVHDTSAADERFEDFLPLVEREARDGRPYVKKAVNWALRQIGKRNAYLNDRAIATAERIIARQGDSSVARWIARDALRELKSDDLQQRLARRRPRERTP